MITTYELTAKYMVERCGVQRALVEAKCHARRESRRDREPFWRYVVVILERRAAVERELAP